MSQALKRTSLHETHTSLQARMVPFAGWEMPVQYRSILAETRAVRTGCGLFDVSHMGRLHIHGPDADRLMDWVLTGSASTLRKGRARYAMICNEQGGIIDDTVFYRVAEDEYLLVCNASNHQYVRPWLEHWAKDNFPDVSIEDRTEDTAMIAFQGPLALPVLRRLCDPDPSTMRPFSSVQRTVVSVAATIGRTGYTGEDGFELIVAAGDAGHVWQRLMGEGAVACGLGARDVLRLEAGLALHGNDIDTITTPLEAGLERFVRLEKDFVGADALRRQKEKGLRKRLVGLAVHGRNIPREGHRILAQGAHIGMVTSGTFSPTLDRNIAMGYVFIEFSAEGQQLQVDIRGRLAESEIVSLPFYSRNVDA